MSAPSSSQTLALTGDLTIREAADTHERLRAALSAGVTTLDLSGVTEMDTAGLQLLAAWRHSGAARDLPTRLQAPSEAVRTVCTTYGLDAWLHAA